MSTDTAADVQSASSVQSLRPYQDRAECAVLSRWRAGTRRVCLVAPTGSGKTVMGVSTVIKRGGRAVWIAHRRELIQQAARQLRQILGQLDVGVIAPGFDLEPFARVQVATVQTLLARKDLPPADVLVLDEAHHYVAADWARLAKAYPNADVLGLTATPERQDGKPLGDLFESLIVAASYSELLTDGHLVPCRVYQPPEKLRDGLAQDPLEAWKRYADGSRTFLFCSSVERAYELAEQFRQAGITAETIEAKTNTRDRDQILQRFASGETTVLTNVYALTEGVDVPAARCVLLARECRHVGMFLQIAGRVLRPHNGKSDAILIDLTGATLVHGMPTEDRVYSLDGDGIRREGVTALRNCLQCGATLPAAQRICPECGFEHVPAEPKPVRIYSIELREVYAGADTPSTAKEREYKRLRELARQKGWSLYFVQKQYKQLFGEMPIISDATEEEQREELKRLQAIVAERGYKPGFAAVRFKEMFGKYPSMAVRRTA